MMALNDEQKKAVSDAVAGGAGLSDVQRMIQDEFGISMTYMDVRFLVDDLGASLKDKEPDRPAEDTDLTDATADDVELVDDQEATAPGAASISVDVDRITKPGAVVSSTIVFSDGVKGSWMLDAMGRLALSPEQEGYQPSQDDVQAFQQKLTDELRKKGF